MDKFHKGFTLIELMILLAIVGILAAVAWPALTGSPPRGPDSSNKVQPANYRAMPNVSCVGGWVESKGHLLRDPYGNEVPCD